jgi:hypothetical protein
VVILVIKDHLAVIRVEQLGTELWFEQHFEEKQAMRVRDVANVLRTMPILQILEIIDESRVFQYTRGRQI